MSGTIQIVLSLFVSTHITGVEMDSDDGVSFVRAVFKRGRSNLCSV